MANCFNRRHRGTIWCTKYTRGAGRTAESAKRESRVSFLAGAFRAARRCSVAVCVRDFLSINSAACARVAIPRIEAQESRLRRITTRDLDEPAAILRDLIKVDKTLAIVFDFAR